MGKKAKKGKKEKAPVEEPSEFDGLSEEQLEQALLDLEGKVEKARADRNYVQVERDTLQTFYDISKQEVSQVDLEIQTRDMAMEELEENHRVEVRVYSQKVKHLEYEHKNNMKRAQGDGAVLETEEEAGHSQRTEALQSDKRSLKLEMLQVQLSNEDRVKQLRDTHKKNLSKMQETFDANFDTLRSKYDEALETLRGDLELRRKVEVHEIEERKNTHINDLMRNHQAAFGQIKTYYNDITHDNLKLIKSLKDEVSEIKKKATANQKLMYEIAQENKRLSEPLTLAVKEVEELRHELKDFDKDKTSLKYSLARLRALRADLDALSHEHRALQGKFKAAEFERNKIYDTFEDTIGDVQRKSEFKNVVLEQRLGKMAASHEEKVFAIRALCAEVDPVMVQRVTHELDHAVDQRNAMIHDMEYHLALVHKTHNDTVRTLTEKLQQLGIPDEDARIAKLIHSQVSSLPAGLLK
jgi:hypothetical protein